MSKPASMALSAAVVLVLAVLFAGMPSLAPATASTHATTNPTTPATSEAATPQAAGGPGAAPAQTAPELSITLNQVVPAVLRPDQAWAVRGEVENGGSTSVDLDQIRLLSASVALDTPEAVDGWIDADSPIEAERLIGSDALDQTLRPGQSRGFLIFVPAGEVDPPFSFASLPLRIDVTSTDGVALAETRTVLPWFAEDSVDQPLGLSWVVPLTLPADPGLSAEPGPERTQAWLDVVGVDSPVRAWLDALAAYDATFVMDPSLLVPLAPATDVSAPPGEEPIPLPEPTETPATPDPVAPTDAPLTDDATATEGPDTKPPVEPPEDPTLVQEAEVALQAQVGQLASDQLWWLPVADPDTAALIDLGVEHELTDQLMSAPLPPSVLGAERLLDRGRHDVAWPSWTRVDDARLTSLRQLQTEQEVSTAVLPRSAFMNASGLDRAPHGVHSMPSASLRLLGYDEGLSTLMGDMPRADSDGAQIQRFLAQTLARYQRSPADPGAVIVAPARGAEIQAASVRDVSSALESAPWVEQVSAASFLTGGEPVSLAGLSGARPAPASPLSTDRITRIEGVRSTLTDLAEIVPRGGAVEQWEPILNGLYSTRWRENPDDWSVPLTELESQVATIVDGVRINPTNVNFLAQEGLIQVTIVNELPITVQDLRLDLEPGNGRLRIVDQPTPITIGPQSRATVQFRARAVASGQVPVQATLSTPSGLQIGQERELGVRVRPTGIWIYWVLGGVGGVILVLGLARAIRRPAAARPEMRSQRE